MIGLPAQPSALYSYGHPQGRVPEVDVPEGETLNEILGMLSVAVTITYAVAVVGSYVTITAWAVRNRH